MNVRKFVEERQGSDSLYPSEIGECIRRVYYRVQGYPVTTPPDPATAWFLERYSWYETPFIKAAIADDTYYWPPHCELQHRLRVGKWSGKLDLVVWNGDDLRIIEIKSVNPGALKKGGIPYDNHIKQAQIYFILAQEVMPAVKEVHLQYIERWNEGKVPTILEPIDVTPAREEVEALIKEMQEVEKAVEGDLPDKPYESDTEHPWHCSAWNYREKYRELRCPYYSHCWEQPF